MKLKNAYSKCMACGGKMKKGMNGISVPRLQGSVVASTPMSKKGQSFAAKNAAKGSNLKSKAKARLKMSKGGFAKSCWPGYEKQGSKIGQSGNTVNNCVKK